MESGARGGRAETKRAVPVSVPMMTEAPICLFSMFRGEMDVGWFVLVFGVRHWSIGCGWSVEGYGPGRGWMHVYTYYTYIYTDLELGAEGEDGVAALDAELEHQLAVQVVLEEGEQLCVCLRLCLCVVWYGVWVGV